MMPRAPARAGTLPLTPAPAPAPGDDGQVMVLIVGYVLLVLLLVTVVAAVSSVYIESKKLLSVADGAAAAAADSYSLNQVGGTTGAPVAALSQDRVNAVVRSYLNVNGSYARFSGLAVATGTGTPDGRTAQVTLTAVVHPGMINFLIPAGIDVTATSTARSQLKR